jgi:Bacterial toxin 23
MVGYGNKDFKLSLGTNLWWGMKGHEGESLNQQTGILGIKSGDFGLTYENDDAPFGKVPLIGKYLIGHTDMYRSASASISIGDFNTTLRMFTGKSGTDESGLPFEEAIRNPDLVDFDSGRTITDKKTGEVTKLGMWKNSQADRYRLGALSVGYKNFNIGFNSEKYRDAFQNWFAHTIVSPQPGFKLLSSNAQFFNQYRTQNPFTVW